MTLLKMFRQNGNQAFCNFLVVLQFGLSCGHQLLHADVSYLLKQKAKILWYGKPKSLILVLFWAFYSCMCFWKICFIVRLMKVLSLCGRIHKLNKPWGRLNFTSYNERRINPIMYKGNTGPIKLKRIKSLKTNSNSLPITETQGLQITACPHSNTSSDFLRHLSRGCFLKVLGWLHCIITFVSCRVFFNTTAPWGSQGKSMAVFPRDVLKDLFPDGNKKIHLCFPERIKMEFPSLFTLVNSWTSTVTSIPK